MRGLLAAALAETALVTWRDLKVDKMPPPPSDYVSVAVIYGGLALFPEGASQVTSLFGWGLVLATFLNFWNPAAPWNLVKSGTVAPGSAPAASLGNTSAVQTLLNPTPKPPPSVSNVGLPPGLSGPGIVMGQR